MCSPEEAPQYIVVMAPHNVYGAINIAKTEDDEPIMVLHRPINLSTANLFIYPVEDEE